MAPRVLLGRPGPLAPGSVNDVRPRLLILDEGWPATLHLAYGLADQGCEIKIITTGRRDERFLGAHLSQIQAPPQHAPEYGMLVDSVVEEFRPALVMPMTDDILRWVWRRPCPWSDLLFPRAEPEQGELVGDKLALSTFLQEEGVLTPQTLPIASEQELARGLRTIGLPAVVKGAVGYGGVQVRIASTETEALSAWRTLSEGGRVAFLQELVGGPTCLAGGLFVEGRAIRIYAAEKTELYPSRTGPAIRVRSTRDSDLLDRCQSVFRILRWTGIASADFIRGGDGRHYFLEVNPRLWGSSYSAADAGVDFCKPLAALLRGEEPEPDLAFRGGVRSTMFPDRLQSRLYGGGLKGLARVALDPIGWLGLPWRRPRLAAHLVHRIYWDWRAETRRPGSAITPPNPDLWPRTPH